MTHLLMSPPNFFNIEYEINPWMDRHRRADPDAAWDQWLDLFYTLVDTLEARVELVPPVAGSPDLVFTANAGLVLGDDVILSRFRHAERQGEEMHDLRWFQKAEFNIVALPENNAFEGEGDAFAVDDRILVGYGFRTSARAPRALERATKREVLSVKMVDPRFYHLDTCLAPLGDGRALWYPDAFTPVAQSTLRRVFTDLIEVPRDEALRFVCNAVVIGDNVITSAHCPVTTAALEERGFTVHAVDLSQFMRAGGSAKCLVLYLDRPVAARKPILTLVGARG